MTPQPTPPDPIDPIVEKVERDIAKFGWSAMHVAPTEDAVEPPYAFTYTIGLWPNHPELILVALRPELSLQLLALAVDRVRNGGVTYEHDHIYDAIIVGRDVAFRQVSTGVSRDLLRMAHRLSPYDDPPQALQLVWPDEHNRFPWDPLYDADALPQQLLGLES